MVTISRIFDQDNESSKHFWAEKIIVALFAAFYLYIFRTVVPNGDALYYASNVVSGSIVFNPNHMLMDPIGILASNLFWAIGIEIEIMDVFKIISGFSCVVALIIFHSILLEIKVKSLLIRIAAITLLFSSRNYLSMAITEEYYMVQMPFLMLALLYSLRWIGYQSTGTKSNYPLYIIGISLGFLTAIALNNIFVLFFIGLYLGFVNNNKSYQLAPTFTVWAFASLILLPLYLGAYFYSSSNLGFHEWFFSYQGKSENPTEVLYGLELSVKGVLISISKLIYNMPVNFVDVGGLGTVLKSHIFSIELEYNANYFKIIIGTFVLLLFVIFLLLLTYWSILLNRHFRLIQYSLIWVASFLVFNFYWNDSSDQFWFQILPVLWIMILIMLGLTEYSEDNKILNNFSHKSVQAVLPAFACLLLVMNSLNVMSPLTFENIEEKYKLHKSLIQENDMEIFTGWDNMQWMVTDESFPKHERLMLMELALETNKDSVIMKNLPTLIKSHLKNGHRVIVSRLFEKDHEVRPWDNLRKAGWPRSRIISLLEEFDYKILTKIGGVSFYQLEFRDNT
ncbi:MAG: hypothetical protein OQL06_12570 [Gammaproteobacteria bacterium]|nr:hypothetical protein [Gammaproteobacteria bacterium]